jgi:hypothetical protein
MKPRQPPVALTPEDTSIWMWVILRSRMTANELYGNSGFHADRRDADLMLWATEVAQFGPASIQLDGIDCRGWTQHEAPVWP